MKPNKPFLLPIPSLLVRELNVFLELNSYNSEFQIQYFYYIIYYITTAIKKSEGDFIPINQKKLQDITVSNIGKYIKILKNGEFIISDNSFIPRKKSIGYKLNPKYVKGTYHFFEAKPGSLLFNKIQKKTRNNKAHYNRLEPFLASMKDFFMKVELDYENAEKWIYSVDNEVKKYHYITSLFRLKDERLRYFKRNKTNNRLDTNFTNLKSDLRQFIIGDFVSIDLKNSQPFFLSQFLTQIVKGDNQQQGVPSCSRLGTPNPSDFFTRTALSAVSKIHQSSEKASLVNLKSFENSVVNGTLYEDFMNNFQGEISRDETKDIILSVLYSENISYSKYNKPFIQFEPEKEIFKSVYPYVYEAIYILKRKKYPKLAISQQRMESFIFIDCIAKELVSEGVAHLSIHDSFLVESHHQDKAMKIIQNIFLEKFGVVPSFHIEPLKKQMDGNLNMAGSKSNIAFNNKPLPFEQIVPAGADLADFPPPNERMTLPLT